MNISLGTGAGRGAAVGQTPQSAVYDAGLRAHGAEPRQTATYFA